jgi:adenosylhomocysteinase
VPSEIDDEVARLKLGALGIEIDVPSPKQLAYADAWNAGT